MQFADSVRSATMHEAEIRHQQVVQDMAKSSLEHTQNMGARIADHVRHETLAEAESRHQHIMRETIAQAERVHEQTLGDVRNHAQSRESSVVLGLQSQIAHLTRLNQDLLARLQAAESSGSVRALSAGGEQDRSDKGSNVEAFDLFGQDEPDPPQSNANDSVNQVLAVLQEEVQNLRDEISKKKGGRSKKQKDSTSSSGESSSSESDPEFAVERKLMRLKGYDKIKVPQLPKSAAEMRGWKNSLISQIVACCKGSEKELLNWLSSPLEGVELSSDKFPVLNRVLGSKLLEAAKGGRFGVDFQALQERSVRQGMQVQGHLLLGRICKKFRLDKERGMSLSQQHLLALKPQGVEIKDLEVFRDRVEFVLSSLETSEYPNEAILRSWLYECLKNVPKLALKIDKFKEASVGDRIRSFQWLWQSMIDCIDESQHDHNTASILNALRSKVDAASAFIEKKDKKADKNDKKKEKAETTKDQRDKVDVAVASSSKTQPKAKSNPNAKSSQSKADGKGGGKDKKEVVAGERGTPCLFYPSGTCRRDPCPFVHDPAAKAKPKAKPKAGSSSVAAAFAVAAGNLPSAKALVPRIFKAVVSSFALLCYDGTVNEAPFLGRHSHDNHVPVLPMQSEEVPFTSFNATTGEVTWLGDTGAGRNIGGVKGIDPDVIGLSNNPVTFATGGGSRSGSDSCRVVGELTGSNECYLLKDSPWALSIGDQVRQGKAFIWLPSSSKDIAEDCTLPKPFLVKPSDVPKLTVSCPENARCYASEVRENVPLFKERVDILHMPSEVAKIGDRSVSGEGSDGYEPSLAPEDIPNPPEGPEDVPEEDVEGITLDHSILHLPKRADCPVCQEAKQDALPARKVKGPRVLTDDKPSEHFGDRIHADHIIVAKGRLDVSKKGFRGETKCLVLYDDHTRILMAYPAPSKGADECVKAFRHFLGKRPAVELHADNTPEFEGTASQLGLVYDATVPYRKTAIINRAIRTLEDITRCCLAQVGNFNELWPVAIKYAATASSIQKWGRLHDHEFEGLHIPFGALIQYKPAVAKTKLGAKTSAGLFLGWRIEAGLNWKRTYYVCDVDSVKSWLEGKSTIQVLTTMTVVHSGEYRFPLREAVKTQLECLEKLPVLRIDDEVRALEEAVGFDEPVEHVSDDVVPMLDPPAGPDPQPKHESITLSRVLHYGLSPGCKACESGEGEHTADCRERFDKLIRGGKFTLPKGVAKGVDSWKLDGDTLIRFHHIKRKKLFNPLLPEDLPVKAKRLGKRVTKVKYFDSGFEETIADENWKGNSRSLKDFWTGQTELELLPESDEAVPGAALHPDDGEQQAKPRPVNASKRSRLTQRKLPGYGTLIEFCCSPDSNLGKVSQSVGVSHIRLTKANGNVAELEVQSQLLEVLDSDAMNGVDLWGSLPCNPWSSWQRLNLRRLGPEFRKKLMAQRLESRKLLKFFFQLAEIILNRGVHVPKEVEPEHIPLSIHELIDKKVWKNDPAAVSEAQKEAQGLIDAGTWDYKNVIPRHELERQSRQSGTKVAIGRLMTIMSWKNAESATERRLKARIVFLGNNVKDEFGLASEFQEIKIIPTTIAGLNINLAFGLRKGNKTSQSDVIKAYIQSDLQTVHDTYIELPDEALKNLQGHRWLRSTSEWVIRRTNSKSVSAWLTIDLLISLGLGVYYFFFRYVSSLGLNALSVMNSFKFYMIVAGFRAACSIWGIMSVLFRNVRQVKLFYSIFILNLFVAVWLMIPILSLHCRCDNYYQCQALQSFALDGKALNKWPEPAHFGDRKVPYEEEPSTANELIDHPEIESTAKTA
eukprot:s601_g14.t1